MRLHMQIFLEMGLPLASFESGVPVFGERTGYDANGKPMSSVTVPKALVDAVMSLPDDEAAFVAMDFSAEPKIQAIWSRLNASQRTALKAMRNEMAQRMRDGAYREKHRQIMDEIGATLKAGKALNATNLPGVVAIYDEIKAAAADVS